MKRRKPDGDGSEPKPVTLEFRYCKAKCFACRECGYFWGPGAREDLRGKPACFPAAAGHAGSADTKEERVQT